MIKFIFLCEIIVLECYSVKFLFFLVIVVIYRVICVSLINSSLTFCNFFLIIVLIVLFLVIYVSIYVILATWAASQIFSKYQLYPYGKFQLLDVSISQLSLCWVILVSRQQNRPTRWKEKKVITGCAGDCFYNKWHKSYTLWQICYT